MLILINHSRLDNYLIIFKNYIINNIFYPPLTSKINNINYIPNFPLFSLNFLSFEITPNFFTSTQVYVDKYFFP